MYRVILISVLLFMPLILAVKARVGREGIPTELISGIWERTRSVRVDGIARDNTVTDLAEFTGLSCSKRKSDIVVLRNVIFLAIVLCHGFRRLGPPYS